MPATAGAQDDRRVVVESGLYKLAFVEFDEQGKLWDPRQRDEAIRLIRSRRGLDPDTGAVQPGTRSGATVIYIHGWRNSAYSAPGQHKDVEKFRVALDQIAGTFKPEHLPLTAVYIGWRGKSVNVENDFLNFYTVWPRSLAAGRVGGEDLRKTLSRLIDAGVAGRDSVAERPRVILIGHSLGAKVLESALERPESASEDERWQAGRVLGRCKTLRSGQAVQAEVDLVVLVNEATRSRKFRKASEFCSPHEDPKVFVRHPDHTRELCNSAENSSDPRCRPYPLFVHVASTADWTTRWMFLAAFLGRTAPHTSSLHTHRVTEIPLTAPAPGDALFTFETRRDGKHAYAVANKKPGLSRQPVWNMRVDGRVLRSHGDIWNEDFTRMLLSMMGGLHSVGLKNYSEPLKRMTSE
jgi:hypothetical protein